jgi:translation initiation factor IF-2
MAKKDKSTKDQPKAASRPPVVAVLGHVDHGKTTLLDTIRKASVAQREHGGITQHIGAYQVELQIDKKPRRITFIDTPGHEAFIKMRSRGATVADIAILVVAADDSVKPQTQESIRQILAAKVPFIVAINKVDLQSANIDKVKQDLAKNGVQVEGFGGQIPFQAISAKKNTGIDKLIETILLMSDMQGIPDEASANLEAVVIETKVDKGKGMVASAIVKKGTLTPNRSLYEGSKQVAKVRAMFDEVGQRISQAGPSKPVEILGFTKLPDVGTVLTDVPFARETEAKPAVKLPDIAAMPDFLSPIKASDSQFLNVVLKADTSGSIEAILGALDEKIHPVMTGLGPISEADILYAKSANAFVIGFNIKHSSEIDKFAVAEKVVVRSYTIIYELLEELEEVASGIVPTLIEERELGKGSIIAEFPFNGLRVAGTKIVTGRLAKGDSVRILHGDTEVAVAKIKSMRQRKDEVNKAETGAECGIIFDKEVDFSLGDDIIAFTK